ncbi:MAG: CatB-related O-acetyltransferase [Nitrospinales bacterium]
MGNNRPDFITIGDCTYGVPLIYSSQWGSKLNIGRFCSIAENVKIFMCSDHNVDWVSTYPFGEMFGAGTPGHPKSKGDITIGNDVWIGYGVTILSGITIGDGAVIGARSVVAKDVLPYSVAVGNPIKHIRFRFTEEQISELLRIKWWDWDYKKISRFIPLLESGDIDKFIEGANCD